MQEILVDLSDKQRKKLPIGKSATKYNARKLRGSSRRRLSRIKFKDNVGLGDDV